MSKIMPKVASASYIHWLTHDPYYGPLWARLKESELAPIAATASTRLIALLLNTQITTKEQLKLLSDKEILTHPNVGRKTIQELSELCVKLNIGRSSP